MIVATTDLGGSLERAWPAFALVAGLLLLGIVAEREGLFRWLGERLERLPGPPLLLATASLVTVAAVTAVLNLDTAVVFVTPVVVHAARRRGIDPAPVAYGVLVMANAASLLLPGANLTNLIVQAGDPIGGARWLVEIAPAGLAAAAVSLAILLLRDRRAWRVDAAAGAEQAAGPAIATHPPRPLAVLIVLAAGLAIVVLPDPALPVLGLGLLAALIAVVRGELRVPDAVRAVGPGVLIGLLAVVTALGWLAREWTWPGDLVADASPLASAAIASLAAITVNNLPAAALLTAGDPAHPAALLVGLNLGPNLLVTGSLASYLWWRTCRTAGVPVSLRGVLTRAPLTAIPAILVAVLLLPG